MALIDDHQRNKIKCNALALLSPSTCICDIKPINDVTCKSATEGSEWIQLRCRTIMNKNDFVIGLPLLYPQLTSGDMDLDVIAVFYFFECRLWHKSCKSMITKP